MNFMKEEDILEIHRKPFVYERLDKDDITQRLDCMIPSNMYVIWHSLAHKEVADQHEKWYSRDFSVQVFTEQEV